MTVEIQFKMCSDMQQDCRCYRGIIKQNSSVLVTETKFSCGFGPRLVSSAGGPAGVAPAKKAIAESMRKSVRTVMVMDKIEGVGEWIIGDLHRGLYIYASAVGENKTHESR
jgi:hypothetical protein